MKWLVILMALLVSCVTVPKKEVPTSFVIDNNTVQLLGLLVGPNVQEALAELQKQPKDKPVKIYFESIGGDLLTTKPLLDEIKSRQTVCYGTVVGGLALALYEACTVRLVGEGSILAKMQYSTVGKDFTDEIKAYAEELEETETDASGKSSEELLKLSDKSGVLLLDTPAKAVNLGFADAVVSAGCSPDTNGSIVTRSFPLQGLPMPISFTLSQCPADRTLISISPEQLEDPKFIPIISQILQSIGINAIVPEPETVI